MAEYAKQVFTFIWAVVNNWAGYTTGGLIVALLWLWSTFRQVPVSRKIGVVVTVIFLFFALFNAWRDQYGAAMDARRQYEETMRPKLQVDLEESTSLVSPTVNQMLIGAAVTNSGAQTSAYGFVLTVILKSGEQVRLGPIEVATIDLRVSDNKVLKTYHQEDNLWFKVKSPIQHGEIKTGVLLFDLGQYKRQDITALILSCKDYMGNVYSSSTVPFRPNGKDPLMGF